MIRSIARLARHETRLIASNAAHWIEYPAAHVLRLEVVPLRKGGVIWKMRGEAKVGGEDVAEAEFMASIQPKPGAAAAVAEPVEG